MNNNLEHGSQGNLTDPYISSLNSANPMPGQNLAQTHNRSEQVRMIFLVSGHPAKQAAGYASAGGRVQKIYYGSILVPGNLIPVMIFALEIVDGIV